MDTQVLIIGAGPTGLTLAIDLGLRGIRCTVIERKPEPQFLPKMERCNARTMEIYRRMGLAERIRAAGMPADCPMDVFIVLSCVEPPLVHTPYPSVAEARAEIAASTDASLPLEPYQLVSQYTVEPLLKAYAESLPSVTLRFGCEFVSFEQKPDHVATTIRTDEKTEIITSPYMVGCDGGGSRVRRQLNIGLAGDANILELRQALYYCEDLYERIPIGKGRHYHVADGQSTFLIVQDSTKHFSLHAVVENDADMGPQFEKAVGMPVKYDMLYVGAWRMNLLLADRYGEGRVFMAGDAVHLVVPTGGLGMNSGVGDAIDLSWKLAATLKGWGGPELLPSYETERRQIGERNVAASRYASTGRRKWRSMYRPNIRDNTPEGEETRRNLIAVANVEQRKSNDMIGAELGYRYADSPLIAEEAGAPPPPEFEIYVPTTWPGARLPHVWLEDGRAVQDIIGYDHGFTLLRLGGSDVSADGLAKAFGEIGAPFRVLDLPGDRAREVYGHDLLLLRPDMHIVWRGNRLTEQQDGLARMAAGYIPYPRARVA